MWLADLMLTLPRRLVVMQYSASDSPPDGAAFVPGQQLTWGCACSHHQLPRLPLGQRAAGEALDTCIITMLWMLWCLNVH